MIVNMIVATSTNNVIGKDGQLPWHMPHDMQYFKDKTRGYYVIMGRKTYQALGKPLKNRTNIVLTRNENFNPQGCVVLHDIQKAIIYAFQNDQKEAYIIGGSSIYEQALPFTDRIFLTRIHESFEGEDHFPELNMDEWRELEREDYKADENNPHDYSFITYVRK